MTIQITLQDLLDLAEAARMNGTSIMFPARSVDGKRAILIITAEPRRKHRVRAAAGEAAKPAKAD